MDDYYATNESNDRTVVIQLTQIASTILRVNNNSGAYMAVLNGDASCSIINFALLKYDEKLKKYFRIRIYKLDLNKYRITIFQVTNTKLRERIIPEKVLRYNILTFNGKILFNRLFMDLYEHYLMLKENKHTSIPPEVIENNKDALDDISFINNIAVIKEGYKGF